MAINGVLIGGALYFVAFAIIAASRITFPFDVEWMEGGMITHAARLLDGQPIYGPPSADFVPFFYTPGYPILLALLSSLFGGLSFGLARAVSVLSTVWAMFLLFKIGQREANWRVGCIAVGLYAALFRTNGTFYDLARPDALFMALLSSAVYVAYYFNSWRGACFSGFLFALGFFTKQTVSVFVPATALYLLWRNWRHAICMGGTAFCFAALGVWLCNRATDGWFWTFIFEGHQGHLFYWKNILMEYWRDVLFIAPILLCLPLLWFSYKVPFPILSIALVAWWFYAYCFRAGTLHYAPHMYFGELWYEKWRWPILIPPAICAIFLLIYKKLNPSIQPQSNIFWLIMYVAGAGASGLNHSTQWAYSNCFMLLSYFAAILCALVLRDLTEKTDVKASWLIPAALLVQLFAWGYAVWRQMPLQEDREAYAMLDRKLSAIKGPIFMPAHPLYGWLRDHKTHVHQMGIQDVAFMGGVQDLSKRLAEHEWAAVVVDSSNRVPQLDRDYRKAETFQYPSKRALKSKTGFSVRPLELWLPKSRN